MTERRKKGPKIAWRDLAQEQDGGARPTGSPDAESPATGTAAAAQPIPAAPAAPAVSAPTLGDDASSPSALAARLDEAYAAMVAETAAGGPPPDINIAAAPAATITLPARAASPTSMPATTPEAEVQRILARLATWVPVARAAAASPAPSVDGDAPALVARRGPALLDDETAPLIAPSGLREAARTRRGRVELLLFRAGGELFALPLGAVEEAIEAPAIHTLPEMPSAMLGVFNLRERLVPTYSPGPSLGVGLAEPAGAALLVRAGDRRLALAADDVEDVMELDLSTLRDPPVVEDTDGILLGVARFGRDLVGILDADALISACLGGRNVENP